MSECVTGVGCVNRAGYVIIKRKGVALKAHREAWSEQHGQIPEGYCVHHNCGNKACVNVEHLSILPHGEHTRLHHVSDLCKAGLHAWTDQQPLLRRDRGDARECRECFNERRRARYREARQQGLSVEVATRRGQV